MKKSELRGIIKKELNDTLKESSVDAFRKQYMQSSSNAHPFVLRAMEELKDDLDFYLKDKKVDFDLLKKKMAELVKLIKQYQS